MRRPRRLSGVRKRIEASPHELPRDPEKQRCADQQQQLAEALLIFEQVKIAQPIGRDQVKPSQAEERRDAFDEEYAPDDEPHAGPGKR